MYVNVNFISEQSLPLCLLSSSVVSNKGYLFMFMFRICLCFEFWVCFECDHVQWILFSFIYWHKHLGCLVCIFLCRILLFLFLFITKWPFLCFNGLSLTSQKSFSVEGFNMKRNANFLMVRFLLNCHFSPEFYHRKSHCAFFFLQSGDIKYGCVLYRSDLINKIDNKLKMIHGKQMHLK